MKSQWIVGIDEVGRGALAGPVTVAAFAFRNTSYLKTVKHPPLRDSKKLSPSQREEWMRVIETWKKKHPRDVHFSIQHIPPKVVDKLNVSQAANKAATQALFALLTDAHLNTKQVEVVLDGGLHLKGEIPPLKRIRTLIKADEKFEVVGLASIAAKVARDAKMRKLHLVHPKYGFASHKGYGTRLHVRAIEMHGIVIVHRLTFVKKWVNLQ
jgi:ribonuclease HII